MKIITWGTRGSGAVSGKEFVKTGGNTTSIQIKSDCLPPETALIVDAGTGIVPLSRTLIKENIKSIFLLFTHYHDDHIEGLKNAAITFNKAIQIHSYGPVEYSYDVRLILKDLMKQPRWPKDFREVGSHFTSHRLEYPGSTVMIIHPKGGLKVMDLDQFERLTNNNRQIPFTGKAYGVEECLVVTMYRSNHPERTISYRFEEYRTNKVFCFLTDHENTAALPLELRQHLRNADLLIMDCQYSWEKYKTMTAGWGHGTPDYCAKTAIEVNVRELGLTHHDPNSTDEDIDKILKVALDTAVKINQSGNFRLQHIFACQDYQEIEI